MSQDSGGFHPFAGLGPVARKEFVHLVRDRGTLFFALFVPILQLFVFGFAINTNVRQIPTVVFDQSMSQRSRELIQRFANSDAFQIRKYAASDDELYGEMRAARAQAGIKIPYDFAERMTSGRNVTVQILVDGSDSTVSGYAVQVFNGIMLLENQRLAGLGMRQLVEGRPTVLYNPATRSPNFFIPGLIAVLVQIMVIVLVALSVVRERERGTLEQLLLTPVQPLGLMVGKAIPYGALGLLEVCTILTIMRSVFQVPIHGNVLVLLLLTLPQLGAVLGLGLLISTRASSQAEAFQLAMGTMLPSIFLSGYIFPVNNMPLIFQWLSALIPTTYYIQIVRGVVLRGAGLPELWRNGAILLLMAIVLMSLAARAFQKKIRG